MSGYVGDRWPFDPRADVVPSDSCPRGVLTRVEAISVFRGQVDASHECHPVVDHDRLLVVAMEGTLTGVERTMNVRSAAEFVSHVTNRASRRSESRQRGTRPSKHSDVNPLRQFREHVAQDRWGGAIAAKGEVGLKLPTGKPYVRPGSCDLIRNPRQRLFPINQDLERTSTTWQRVSLRP